MGLKTKLAAAFLASTAIVGTIIGETENAYNRGAATADTLNIGAKIADGLRGTDQSIVEKVTQPAASIVLGLAGGTAETLLNDQSQLEAKNLPLLPVNVVAGIIGGLSVHFSDATDGTSNADLAAAYKVNRATDPALQQVQNPLHTYAQQIAFKHHMGR